MQGRMMKVTVAALAAMAMVPALAHGHTVKKATTVTIEYGEHPEFGQAFFGEVNSPSGKCVRNREVTVAPRSGLPLGSVMSDADGDWVMPTPGVANGDYFASVSKRVTKRNQDHKHICKAAESQDDVTIAHSCESVVLTGSGDYTDKLSVDDDLEVFVNDVSTYLDDNQEAGDLDPVPLGPLTAGDSIRIVAKNSDLFGDGPVSIDPIWLHCFATDGGISSTALDENGFSGEAVEGATFYDATFVMPDFFD